MNNGILRSRLVRFGLPGLVLAGVATGSAVAAWPDQDAAGAAAPTSVAVGQRTVRPDRDAVRAPLIDVSPTGRASVDATAEKAAIRAAAAREAAAEQAAKIKAEQAAKKAAAEKKAEAKKRAAAEARKKAAAEAARKKAARQRAARLADYAEPADRDGRMYTDTAANVRVGPSTDYDVVTTLEPGARVAVTERSEDGWAQIVLDGKGRWIHRELLTDDKPEPAGSRGGASSNDNSGGSGGSGGISFAPCPSGSAVENGLTPDAIKVHRAICAQFPQVSSYGGVRPDPLPEHPSGRALDAMISDNSVGWEIANWVRAHRQELGVSEILYAQHIWTVQRNSEGWRTFPDRGSATANHYDHVHVTVYGNAAG